MARYLNMEKCHELCYGKVYDGEDGNGLYECELRVFIEHEDGCVQCVYVVSEDFLEDIAADELLKNEDYALPLTYSKLTECINEFISNDQTHDSDGKWTYFTSLCGVVSKLAEYGLWDDRLISKIKPDKQELMDSFSEEKK